MSVHLHTVPPFEIEGVAYTFKRLKVREPQRMLGYMKSLYLLALADLESYADRFPTFKKHIISEHGKLLQLAFSSEYALNYILDFIQEKLVRLDGLEEKEVSKEEFDNLPPIASVILLENFYKHPDLIKFRDTIGQAMNHPLVQGLLSQLKA